MALYDYNRITHILLAFGGVNVNGIYNDLVVIDTTGVIESTIGTTGVIESTNYIFRDDYKVNVNGVYNDLVVIGTTGVIGSTNYLFRDDYFSLCDNNNNHCNNIYYWIITMFPYDKINRLQGLCFVQSDLIQTFIGGVANNKKY